MKIGMIGGTFDPIHNGHLALAKAAHQAFDLDEIWFLPNGNPPHKDRLSMKTKVEQRVKMIELSIQTQNNYRIETYEVERHEISPTADTLAYFKQKFPQHEFYFILGGDSIFSLETWIRPQEIFRYAVLIAAYRKGRDKKEEFEKKIAFYRKKYKGKIEVLSAELPDISSTSIREKLRIGSSIVEDVPEEVAEFIQYHGLYQ